MKLISAFAIASALALGGIASAPAAAQPQAAPAKPERKLKLSKGATKQLAALQTAAAAPDRAAFQAALAAAQAAATTSDDRYFIAQMQLKHSLAGGDDAAKIAALQAVIASGGATAEELPRFYRGLASLQYNAKDMQGAQASFAKLAELTPNDPEIVLNLAKIAGQAKQYPAAVGHVETAIARTSAAGGKASEETYRLGLQYALDGKLTPQATKLSQALIAAYPNQKNWRDSLLVYRDLATLDEEAQVDALRLMRAAKALGSQNDYLELAYALHEDGLPGEVKAVLEEGTASRTVDPNQKTVSELMTLANGRVGADRSSLATSEAQAAGSRDGKLARKTADAYLGYGDYAKATTLYRTALQKGSVDANLVNTRLGMALAMAGQKAEAEAAFKAVTGPRADLASFWMLWMNQRA